LLNQSQNCFGDGKLEMSETELVEKLAAALAKLQPASIPVSIDLWDVATIARFLKRDPEAVRERVCSLPDFPKAIRLPTGVSGRGRPLYKAAEVIAWCEKYREKN
jgi:hypothetical protein